VRRHATAPSLVRSLRRYTRARHLIPLVGVATSWLLLEFALGQVAVDSRRPQVFQPARPTVGEIFNDLSSLRERQEATGFELLDLVDVTFPVRVLTVHHAPGVITVVGADGGERRYRGDEEQLLQAMAVAGPATGRGWIVWRQTAAGAAMPARISLR
jgi:hypothetical protein